VGETKVRIRTLFRRLAAHGAHARVSVSRRRSDSGVEALEFALVLPILLTLLFGIISMGLVFYHYEMLIGATETGCRYLAAARGATSTPYSNAVSAIDNYATGLTASSLQITITVNGSVCASDAACLTAISNGQGQPVQVQTSYPCSINIMGTNFAPNCILTQKLIESIE
jgi:Flp pilus assembly protein TadG